MENAEREGDVNTESNKPYESYIRVLIPADAGTGLIEVIGENEKKEVKPEVYGAKGSKEIGIFVKLERGEVVAFVFSWESGAEIKLEKEGYYSLKWIKQPGVEGFPVDTEINLSSIGTTFEYENLSLTEENGFGYNTNLSRDIISRIFWKNGTNNQGD